MGSLTRTIWLVAWPFLMATTLAHGTVEELTNLDIEHNLKFESGIDKAQSVSPEDFTQTVLQTLESNVHVALAGLAWQAPLEPARSCPWARGERIASPLLSLQVIRLQI